MSAMPASEVPDVEMHSAGSAVSEDSGSSPESSEASTTDTITSEYEADATLHCENCGFIGKATVSFKFGEDGSYIIFEHELLECEGCLRFCSIVWLEHWQTCPSVSSDSAIDSGDNSERLDGGDGKL